MLRVIVALLAGLLLCAQTPMVPGFPPGTFQNRAAIDAAPAATYQGPGDVVSGWTAWGSCARAYNSATAAGTNMCDLVDSSAPTTVICTLKTLSTGFVDLASASCTGSVTPATKCAAATGGVCNISKVYDQSGNANDWTQTTAANQPTLTFAALNGLPAITTPGGANVRLETATKTIAQPFTFTGVYNRTSGIAQGGVIGGDAGVTICAGAGNAANVSFLTAGTSVTAAATDAAYHAINHMANGASSALNVDGSDTSGVNVGAGAFSGNTIRIGRCAGVTLVGRIMEAGIYPNSTTSTQRNDLSANQHSSADGYNF